MLTFKCFYLVSSFKGAICNMLAAILYTEVELVLFTVCSVLVSSLNCAIEVQKCLAQ